jgi:hypothetical protein
LEEGFLQQSPESTFESPEAFAIWTVKKTVFTAPRMRSVVEVF